MRIVVCPFDIIYCFWSERHQMKYCCMHTMTIMYLILLRQKDRDRPHHCVCSAASSAIDQRRNKKQSSHCETTKRWYTRLWLAGWNLPPGGSLEVSTPCCYIRYIGGGMRCRLTAGPDRVCRWEKQSPLWLGHWSTHNLKPHAEQTSSRSVYSMCVCVCPSGLWPDSLANRLFSEQATDGQSKVSGQTWRIIEFTGIWGCMSDFIFGTISTEQLQYSSSSAVCRVLTRSLLHIILEIRDTISNNLAFFLY